MANIVSCAKVSKSLRLPDFIVIGEQKAGTGWIRDRLREHPDVFMYPREINFFNRADLYGNGLEWYAQRFAAAGPHRIAGEKSPEYFWFDAPRADYNRGIAALIRRDIPAARIVLVLRNPIDRAVSALNHHLYHRGGRIDPREARRGGFGELVFGNRAEEMSRLGALERGLYHERLRTALDTFGDNLLVLIFEDDIVGDPTAGMVRLCAHIGADPKRAEFNYSDNSKETKPSYPAILLGYHVPLLRPLIRRLDHGKPFKVTPSAADRERLRNFYADDVRLTETLLSRSLEHWRS